MTVNFDMISLTDLLIQSNIHAEIDPDKSYQLVTVKLWGKGVELRNDVDGASVAGSKLFVVRENQFILSKIDARNGAFGLIPSGLDEAVVSADFPVFTLNTSKIIPEYLKWLSKTSDFIQLCVAASEGTTNRVRLKIDRFLATKISLPPLEEQHRIVARIEELAAKIEEARGVRQNAMQETEALHSSLLSSIFNKMPIVGQLKNILITKPQNGWSARCDNLETGIPVLSLGAITGFRYKDTEYKRTSEITLDDAHYWLKPGDLLITRSNTPDLVGHAAIYNGNPSPCIYPDLIMRLEINEDLAEKQFVHNWLRSNTVRDYIKKMAKGTSQSMKKISQETVMNIPFPLNFPLYEQKQVTEQLNQLDWKMSEVKRKQSETTAELDALLPSILDKAFKGEL